MGKYRWTYEDDFTCCLEYLKYVFLDEESYDANDLIDKLCEQLPHILPSSIQMKVKNIKQIALESGLEDSVSVTPLYNYSEQCKRAFDDASEAIRADVEKMDDGGNIRGGGPEDEAFLTPPPVDPNRHIFELAILSTIHKKPKLLIDAEVMHEQFGYGRISDVDGRLKASVAAPKASLLKKLPQRPMDCPIRKPSRTISRNVETGSFLILHRTIMPITAPMTPP